MRQKELAKVRGRALQLEALGTVVYDEYGMTFEDYIRGVSRV
jgi:hypothetical protein